MSSITCLQKSFFKIVERYLYKRSKEFADAAICTYLHKYTFKYLKKRQKLNLDSPLDDDNLNYMANNFTSILLSKDEASDAVNYSQLKNFMKKTATDDDMNTENDIETQQIGTIEQKPHVHLHARRTYPTPVKTSDDRDITIDDQSLHEIIEYAIGLHNALTTNDGLEHGKVKEYWIYRGPRILLMWIIGIVAIGLLNEFYDGMSTAQKLSDLLRSLILLLTALYMLYWRLPDSIDTAYCRTAHDHYVHAKRIMDKSQLKAPAESLDAV